MNYSAVIVAAGSSTRFGRGISKMLYVFSDGDRVIDRTLKVFLGDDECTQIIVVCNEEVQQYLQDAANDSRIRLCPGGASRSESVLNGLSQCREKIVLVHDGARCFLEKDDLEAVKQAVSFNNGAILVGRMVDTVKVVKDGYVVSTVDRDTLKRAQTPQRFPTEELLRCYREAGREHFENTDESGLFERYSEMKIACIESRGHNTKITVWDDVRGE